MKDFVPARSHIIKGPLQRLSNFPCLLGFSLLLSHKRTVSPTLKGLGFADLLKVPFTLSWCFKTWSKVALTYEWTATEVVLQKQPIKMTMWSFQGFSKPSLVVSLCISSFVSCCCIIFHVYYALYFKLYILCRKNAKNICVLVYFWHFIMNMWP